LIYIDVSINMQNYVSVAYVVKNKPPAGGYFVAKGRIELPTFGL
jgi:hypothetical protein